MDENYQLGDRFKRRLPKFVGKISDMHDLFQAEDREFERIDFKIDEFTFAFFIHTVQSMAFPDAHLRRLERDYKLPSTGDTAERVARIIAKMKGLDTTTEKVIIDICRNFGYRATFHERYSEYGFTLNFYNARKFTPGVMIAIDEVKPAHLNVDIKLTNQEKLVLKEKTKEFVNPFYPVGKFHQCGTIFRHQYTGKKVVVPVKIPNGTAIRPQRNLYTGETKSGGVKR